MVKNLPANAGDVGSVPGLGRYLGEGNGNPLQYSCLGNLMDEGSWWAAVYGAAQSRTRLKRLSSSSSSSNPTLEKEMAAHTSTLTWGSPVDGVALVGYSPWGGEESDTTEQLHFH